MNIAAEKNDAWLSRHTAAQLPGQALPWLRQQRQQALTHYAKVGLPGVRDEQWRYTNLRALKNRVFTMPLENQDTSLTLPASDNPRLVFVDGFYRADLSNNDSLVSVIRCTNLVDALEIEPDIVESNLIEKFFSLSLPAEQHGFSALNTAYCQDGYVLILPDNTVLDEVLEVYFISSQNGGSAQDKERDKTQHKEQQYRISHLRNLLIAGANSQCKVIERHVFIGNHRATEETVNHSVYLNNTVTEIHAANNAQVDHYKLQQESQEAFHIGGVFIRQAANSQVKSHNIALSGLVTRNDIHCDLLGQGAHVEMNGLVIGTARQHIDNHTQVNHAVPHCSSDEYYKSILDDHSRSVFRGRIVVAQDAQLTNADQQNNNLLLSKYAEADTLPQLEIYADDVKCSHGATVGQLDPKSLFYLRSRGIDAESAKALLSFAFANEVIERIQIESVRAELTQCLAGQLADGLEARV